MGRRGFGRARAYRRRSHRGHFRRPVSGKNLQRQPFPAGALRISTGACSAAAQSQDASAPPRVPAQDPAPPAEAKKPKKVWTNEEISRSTGVVSVVGDAKSKPQPAAAKPANAQYAASVRKQLEKLQGQIADIDKQLVDLKNFSEGEPSTSASGVKLNKNYSRET